jgi:hypothetical protein
MIMTDNDLVLNGPDMRVRLRQIGWIGHSTNDRQTAGRFYSLDEDPRAVENGGFSPLWQEIESTARETVAPGVLDDLRAAINRNSLENGSNTPDHILARYLAGCLESFDRAARDRDHWYGIQPAPGWRSTWRPDVPA